MLIKLTNEQVSNLVVFLERTELRGKEVSAYTELMRAIHTPVDPVANSEVPVSDSDPKGAKA